MPHTIDIVNMDGLPFRAVFLPDGMSVNRPAANKYNKHGKPMIEFYDRRYADDDRFPSDGQFVADYYTETLLEGDLQGLNLVGHVPAWQIDRATMRLVLNWLTHLSRPLPPIPTI